MIFSPGAYTPASLKAVAQSLLKCLIRGCFTKKPLVSVKWDASAGSFICQTCLPAAALQCLLPFHALATLVRVGSGADEGSEFWLQAYLSNVAVLARVVDAADG